MPYRMTFGRTTTFGGNQYTSNVEVVDDGQVAKNPLVVVGKNGGVLTARVDTDTGDVTMPAGHGFITGDKVDIYWNVAGILGSRRTMTATVAGNVVTVDGGAGDNLPALNTAAIHMRVPQVEDFVVTGDNVKSYVANSAAPGWICFLSAANAVLKAIRITVNGGTDSWNNIDGGANPLAGLAIGKVSFSHGEDAVQSMTAAVINS